LVGRPCGIIIDVMDVVILWPGSGAIHATLADSAVCAP
jgi:hypothetical protein